VAKRTTWFNATVVTDNSETVYILCHCFN